MKATARKQSKKTVKTPVRSARARANHTSLPVSMADKVIMFIETFLRIPDGMHLGKPVVLDEFQKRFIRKVWDNPVGTRKAIFSAGRKNAKTAIIAMIVLACLVGPAAVENSQIESGAMSRDQAAKVFDYCVKMIRLSPDLESIIHIVPSHKKLVGLPLHTSYTAMSADAQTAHGGSPRVVIMDELGQVRGPRSDFYDAMVTSQGAHADPLLLIISTQAANNGDLLSIIIDDALAGNDPHTVVDLYTAPLDCDLMDRKAWAMANPALGKFLNEDSVRLKAEEATRMPSAEATFRNLILNQRVEATAPFISRDSWNACAAHEASPLVPIEECTEIYAGLDLSGRTDLTAFVLLGLHAGAWHAHPYFWTPAQGLVDRSKRDRAPYDVWHDQGYIRTTPGASIDYEAVAREIAEICAALTMQAIAFDRWRMDVLKKEFERIGVVLPLAEWGQGFKDMSPAMDSLEAKILNKTLRHGSNPVLTMCMANAVVTKDPAANRKMDKMKTTGRIDGAVALAMAAGIADRTHETQGDISDFINDPLML